MLGALYTHPEHTCLCCAVDVSHTQRLCWTCEDAGCWTEPDACLTYVADDEPHAYPVVRMADVLAQRAEEEV